MKRKVCFFIVIILLTISVFQSVVMASDVSLLNNNTAYIGTTFVITESGRAIVSMNYEGYPNVTSGAIITVKIEKRNFLLFWSDVIDETITVVGDSYFNELYYQLEDKGTYRCTVVYTVSGTGGIDDVLTFEDTAKYE